MATLSGGEVYVECKRLLDFGHPVIELQIGSACFLDESLLGGRGYSGQMRDRFAAMVEDVASLDGFLMGFSVRLGDDAAEGHYRRWFRECVVGRELSLPHLLTHDYLFVHALAVGPGCVAKHGRDVFLKCPAWRVSAPRENVICVFMDNLVHGMNRGRLEKISHVREALAYLQRYLKDSGNVGNEPQGE